MPDAGENKIGDGIAREIKTSPAMTQTQTQSSSPAPALPPSIGLLADYKPGTPVFDELLAGGNLRPHYTGLMQGLDELGVSEIKRRDDTARRLVHEQGITYNVYGDPRGMERP